MEILIRKEPSGSIYLDKQNACYFEKLKMNKPPYNFNKITIEDGFADCEASDFNDDLTFDTVKYYERKENSKLDALRRQREVECFPIINRGQLWYDTLTEAQKAELKEWYIAWLDVTDTLVIPNKPNWI